MSTPYTPHKDIAWIDAHGGSTADWQCSASYASATGNMEGWSAYLELSSGRPADLSKHIEQDNGHRLMLNITLACEHARSNGTPICWSSSLVVGVGRYVRAYGYAPDFPAAVEAATGYHHESRQIGGLTWWHESDGGWISWLGEMRLHAHLVTPSAHEAAYWHFQTSGDAPTLEEAALLAAMRLPSNHS